MDQTVKIAVCNRKTNLKYKNQEHPWSYLKERNRIPVRTSETAEEYQKASKEQREAAKDQGGFVGGWLKDGRRLVQNVIMRCVGALDADSIPAEVDFPALVRDKLGRYEYFLYSTHSHTPEAPRFRIAILFSREVTPDEYPALMRMISKQIGMDYFDDSTYQANRMMYWASCPVNGAFIFEENNGEALSPDVVLSMYDDWRDVSQWPTSSRQSEAIRKNASRQQDPLSKGGLVGVFNRAYFPIENAIAEFLGDVYEPAAAPDRYSYIPADSVAGVVIYDERFVYSFHASDPACERLSNAFDIVRAHKFRDLDEKDSYKAMCEFAQEQLAVKVLLAEERERQAQYDFGDADDDWKSKLTYMPRSKLLENSVWNLMLILTHDPDFAHFGYNEMASRIQVTGEVPWDRPVGNRYWRDADTAQMKALIDMRYLPFSTRNHDVCFTKVADDRRFHPIRDYLNSLPPWDGVERIPTLFTKYLQADDTTYVHTVSRKTFAAAVARVYHPGVKFDCILVLDGAQGIGKSTILKDLVGDEFYCETLSLTDMEDKTGAEKLQGFWFAEIGELAGMKKADIEKVKDFLTVTDDKYRPSYGKVVESHPRQCVIIATVNGERGYLRDITGNRRFWIVKCHQEEQAKRWRFTPDDKDQIWAEAKHLYENGEKLYLEDDMLRVAEELQRDAMEVDERQGLVEEYLDMPLPVGWERKDIYERKNYVADRNDPLCAKGTVRRETVSNAEIWCECFGKNLSELKPTDSYAIAALMMRVDGWVRTKTSRRIPFYGKQRLYCRKDET
jgi:predicted P-loop ATPase